MLCRSSSRRPIRQRSLVRASSASSLERLLKVCDNIVNVLCSDRDTDPVFSDSRGDALFLGELFVRG